MPLGQLSFVQGQPVPARATHQAGKYLACKNAKREHHACTWIVPGTSCRCIPPVHLTIDKPLWGKMWGLPLPSMMVQSLSDGSQQMSVLFEEKQCQCWCCDCCVYRG
jgi:hypothetical protein